MAGRVGSRAGIAAGLAAVSIVAGIMSGASATAAGMRPADVAAAPEPTIQPGRPGGPPVAPPPSADPAPTADPDPTATPTPTADPAPTATPTPVASVRVDPVAPPADLAVVRVASTLGTVYPLATGYHDRARFVLQAVTADRHAVAVTGVAVLRLGGRVVKTWTVRAAGPSLDWDGRIGGRVVPGLYRLTARVHEPGRPDHAASARVRISAKHFALGTAAIEAPAARTGAASRMPDRAARAFRYGRVRVRITTDATVRGAAELLFVSRAGTVALPLADGLHTTASLTVPDGVTRFSVYTRWAPGAVHLHSLRVRWTYRRLVD